MTDKIEFIEVAVSRGWKGLQNGKYDSIIVAEFYQNDYAVNTVLKGYYWESRHKEHFDIAWLGTWEQITTDKSLWKCVYGEELVCSFCSSSIKKEVPDNDYIYEICDKCVAEWHGIPLWQFKMIQCIIISDQQDEWIKAEVAQLKKVE